MNTKNENLKKQILFVVNASLRDTEYLYYLLDVKGVTLKGLLLPADMR